MKRKVFLFILMFTFTGLFADTYRCYKFVGFYNNGRVQNTNNIVQYTYIAFSEDFSVCYEVQSDGSLFPMNYFKPDFTNSPVLLSYENYYYSETTEEGYLVYESKAQYIGDQMMIPAQKVVFSEDLSRLNHYGYFMSYDHTFDFSYAQQGAISVYEESEIPRRQKKKTPLY